MKKVTLVVCAFALVFGSLALVAEADSPQQHWNEVCKFFGDFGFDNHGQCVSALATRLNNDGPAKLCKTEFRGREFWEWRRFKNRGDCVSWYRDRFNH